MIGRALLLVLCALATGCGGLGALAARAERTLPVGKYRPPQKTSKRCEATARRLEHVAAALKITLTVGPVPNGFAYGAYDHAQRAIYLDPQFDRDVCGRAEVLSHELGHALQPPGLTGREGQVFADGVSFLVVTRGCGYSPAPRYADYLATIKADVRILRVYRREIELMADVLLTRQFPQK